MDHDDVLFVPVVFVFCCYVLITEAPGTTQQCRTTSGQRLVPEPKLPAQTHRFTDTQTNRHTDTPTHRHTDTRTHTAKQKHSPTATQPHSHTTTEQHSQTATQPNSHSAARTAPQPHHHTATHPHASARPHASTRLGVSFLFLLQSACAASMRCQTCTIGGRHFSLHRMVADPSGEDPSRGAARHSCALLSSVVIRCFTPMSATYRWTQVGRTRISQLPHAPPQCSH